MWLNTTISLLLPSWCSWYFKKYIQGLLLTMMEVLDDSGYVNVHNLGFPFTIVMIEKWFQSVLAVMTQWNMCGSVYGGAAGVLLQCRSLFNPQMVLCFLTFSVATVSMQTQQWRSEDQKYLSTLTPHNVLLTDTQTSDSKNLRTRKPQLLVAKSSCSLISGVIQTKFASNLSYK